MKSILDPSFKYTPSRVHADGSDYLRAKFKRLMREEEAKRAANKQEVAEKVTTIIRDKQL